MRVIVSLFSLLLLLSVGSSADEQFQLKDGFHATLNLDVNNMTLGLPTGAYFTVWGDEPTTPAGDIASLGPGLRWNRKGFFVSATYAFGYTQSNFRSGFVDRRGWFKPSEGEAYVYSRVSQVGPVSTIRGGITFFVGKEQNTYMEIGLGRRMIPMSITQGYDRYNSDQVLRTFDADASMTTLNVSYNMCDENTTWSVGLEFGLQGKLDCHQFGVGSSRDLGLTISISR